jgi:hypothetical protein
LKSLFTVIVSLITVNLVFAQPVITSFAATKGPVGTPVTISGSNFSATPINNIVYFGAVRANVTAASTNSLTVLAPAGATYEPITVTVGGLVGYSSVPFIITFTGGENEFKPGSFDQPKYIEVSQTGSVFSFVKDLDGDGKSELITRTNSNEIKISKNVSSFNSIAFNLSLTLTTPFQPSWVGSEDLDGDGKPDSIMTFVNDSNLCIFKNTTTAGNISFGGRIDIAAAAQQSKIYIQDLDLNGKPDLFFENSPANLWERKITILKNLSSTGTFLFSQANPIQISNRLRDAAVGDLDGDGKPEIAVTLDGEAEIKIFRNISFAGLINYASGITVVQAPWIMKIEFGDIDSDGQPDLIYYNSDYGNTVNEIDIKRNISTVGKYSIC